jgi:hypothetical protein
MHVKNVFSRVNAAFYIVGMNYYPFPGIYPYPAGNGRVHVYG